MPDKSEVRAESDGIKYGPKATLAQVRRIFVSNTKKIRGKKPFGSNARAYYIPVASNIYCRRWRR